MFVAKPNAINNNGLKKFETAKEACKYLAEYTGMGDPEQGMPRFKQEDWEILGKLYEEGEPSGVSLTGLMKEVL